MACQRYPVFSHSKSPFIRKSPVLNESPIGFTTCSYQCLTCAVRLYSIYDNSKIKFVFRELQHVFMVFGACSIDYVRGIVSEVGFGLALPSFLPSVLSSFLLGGENDNRDLLTTASEGPSTVPTLTCST